MKSLYEEALKLSVRAHEGQVRKHDGSPYIIHPVMVAHILAQAGFEEVVVAAALVHDVLEDTPVTVDELRATLGDEVVRIVTAVSEDTTLPWEERKAAYVAAVVAANESVWAVSVADKIHNAVDFTQSHAEKGPDAWKVFNRGKEKKLWFERLLLRELRKVWSHPLLDNYQEKIAVMEQLTD